MAQERHTENVSPQYVVGGSSGRWRGQRGVGKQWWASITGYTQAAGGPIIDATVVQTVIYTATAVSVINDPWPLITIGFMLLNKV